MKEDEDQKESMIVQSERDPLLNIKFESVTRDMIYIEYDKLLK